MSEWGGSDNGSNKDDALSIKGSQDGDGEKTEREPVTYEPNMMLIQTKKFMKLLVLEASTLTNILTFQSKSQVKTFHQKLQHSTKPP